MAPEIMVPQSVGVTLFAFGLVVGAALFGGVAYCWGYANGGDRNYRRGYSAAWEPAHQAGFQDGLREAGVLDRLVTLDSLQQDAEYRWEALMRRHRGASAKWRHELGGALQWEGPAE